jgi:hypothetical protein
VNEAEGVRIDCDFQAAAKQSAGIIQQKCCG